MKTRWLIYILLGVFLSSCYKEENIEGEEDEPKYKVEDSEDPLDHFIYGFIMTTVYLFYMIMRKSIIDGI